MKRSALAARRLLAQRQAGWLGLREGGSTCRCVKKALPATVRAGARCVWAVLEKDPKWRNDDYTAQTREVTSCAACLQPRNSIKN